MARNVLKWQSGDKYITIRCPLCHWPFHCPIEQAEHRIKCRACE